MVLIIFKKKYYQRKRIFKNFLNHFVEFVFQIKKYNNVNHPIPSKSNTDCYEGFKTVYQCSQCLYSEKH
ncbi:unnamed protein product [Rhizophagus irregularis]|nr:unnamed protein product [Rhizophagus irregularis]